MFVFISLLFILILLSLVLIPIFIISSDLSEAVGLQVTLGVDFERFYALGLDLYALVGFDQRNSWWLAVVIGGLINLRLLAVAFCCLHT